MTKPTTAVVVLTALFVPTSLIWSQEPAQAKQTDSRVARQLPGSQANGSILLPNQWSLKPAGEQIEIGDFPVQAVLHPSGKYLAILHAGYGDHEVIIVDAKRKKMTCRVEIPQAFYGLCFSPDGKQLFASGGQYEMVHAYTFAHGLLSHHRQLSASRVKDFFLCGGMTIDGEGKNLFVAGTWGDAVCSLPINSPEKRSFISLEKESFPYTCLVDGSGRRLFTSLWNKAAVAVIDLKENKVVGSWPTEKHPTEMALSPDGKTLYVACANSTKVSVVNAETGKGLETLSCALYPAAPTGNTPNSLCLTPDGQMLFVANADANNVAVFQVGTPGQGKPLGFIPTGWYPTSVRFNPADNHLYITNGKGTTPKANPQGPNPLLPRNQTVRQYIAGLFRGTLGILPMPGPDKIPVLSKAAYECSPLRQGDKVVGQPDKENPIPREVGGASPIKHCLYIIKENRTYDQVFGDMKEGNGDPNLCLFPEAVTPNHHRLAREFVLLDNFYVEGEVSADGHEWSMGAYATDFVEKVWPLNYRPTPRKKIPYPAEGDLDAIARPAGGYLWDRCAEAGVSYRSYGEWITNGKRAGDPAHATVKALENHFDPQFRGFDMAYPDRKRADRFLEELARFEREGSMPRLIIMRLPSDHTSGSKVGMPTPTAYLADNDLALGRVVEGVSRSKFWNETSIFVVEDDAQNGSDHVDAHRTVALVISPYVRRRQIDSTLYSTSSMLRTMELILGLKPMSQFDAAARPMFASFQSQADFLPYQHLLPRTDRKAINRAGNWGAKISAGFDLTKEDAADDLLLNEVIWKSVKGETSPMPAPVRAAFVFPHLKEKD